jgi:lysophospholipase L1-like esterase
MSNILIFWTSTTRWAWDRELGWWVNRLRLFIDNRKNDDYWCVYNQWISGDSTEWILKRLKDECESRSPDIIIFAVATNDARYCKSKNSNNVDLNKFKLNLDLLLERSLKYTNNIVFVWPNIVDESLVTPIPWDEDIFYYNKDIKKYDWVIEVFCKKNNLWYIQTFDLLNKSDFDDGLHPNVEWHKKIFERVKEYFLDNNLI